MAQGTVQQMEQEDAPDICEWYVQQYAREVRLASIGHFRSERGEQSVTQGREVSVVWELESVARTMR